MGLPLHSLRTRLRCYFRILAEYGEVEIGASEPFDKLLHKVGEKCTSVPGHKATISRLNKARVAFKHHGLPISNETALTFMDSVEAFLTEVSRDEMKLDFGSVSLVPMIGHQRTENWLHKAEKFAGGRQLPRVSGVRRQSVHHL